MGEIRRTMEKGFRTLVTALTKKMAEDLTVHLRELTGSTCATCTGDHSGAVEILRI